MAQRINTRPWVVQGRRGGSWVTIPNETYARREQAQHRMTVYRSLITDAEFRVVKITNLPREEEN
jgi:hypothetical protein